MADVRPFTALRFDPEVVGDWGAVLGPPYDIIDDAQRDALLRSSPYQISHVETASGSAAIAAAADRFAQWQRDGALIREQQPAFYLTEHEFEHDGRRRSRTCLYAAVRLTPWSDGDVLPHEWTMPGPKSIRVSLRHAVRADISPLMSLLPDRRGTIAAALQPLRSLPVAAEGVDGNGERHTLRVIDDPASTTALQEALATEPIYMADGHHRYESALEDRDQVAAAAGDAWSGEEPENFVLMGLVLARDPGLIVGSAHRLVHVAPPADALAQLTDHFTVRDATGATPDELLAEIAAAGQSDVALAVSGLDGPGAHILTASDSAQRALPDHVPASWAALGAALLQYVILKPVFGIDDEALAAGQAVTYPHDASAALAAVKSGRATAAFFINPPTLEQTFAAADAGDRMPQKSTFFTPKLPTGIVLHAFD